MSFVPPRQPPRFVPTLTDVVSGVSLGAADILHNDEPDALEPVKPQPNVEPADLPLSAPGLPHSSVQDWPQMAQSMQARVMERLDASLEERLRYALADMVQMHSQSLYLALREDLERVVNSAVHEAIAQEMTALRHAPDPEN